MESLSNACRQTYFEFDYKQAIRRLVDVLGNFKVSASRGMDLTKLLCWRDSRSNLHTIDTEHTGVIRDTFTPPHLYTEFLVSEHEPVPVGAAPLQSPAFRRRPRLAEAMR